MVFVIKIIALSIFFPMIFQLIVGTLSIGNKVRFSFKTVCTYSIISQFVFAVVAFIALYLDFTKESQPKCLNPMVGIVSAIVACFIFLIVLITVQAISNYFVKKIKCQ